MKKFAKVISLFLIFNIAVFSFPLYAINLESLGLNVPNIQNLQSSEKSGPQTFSDIAMESPIDPLTYKVGPGDQLTIHIIVGDSELSVDHNLLVGADGNIFFPNIGAIYLSGLSLAQAKIKINSQIKKAYREHYELFVLLSQPKKVKIYLSGMVRNPGPLAVYDNLRVSEVIAQAGGVASGASNRFVYIKRKLDNGAEKLLKADLFEAYRSRNLDKDIRVQSGDVIEVPDADNNLVSKSADGDLNDKLLFEGKESFVYIYGDINKSGRFDYIPGKKVSDYISYAGGPTARGLLRSTTLTRQVDGKPKKYSIDVSDILYNGNSRNDIEVLGGDVINVPGDFFYVSDFSSFANTILLAVTLYSTLRK